MLRHKRYRLIYRRRTYVVRVWPDGFVIAHLPDALVPSLGFTHIGSYGASGLRCAVKSFLDAKGIHYFGAGRRRIVK